MTLIELTPTVRMEKSEVHENMTVLNAKYRRNGVVIQTCESLYGIQQSRILVAYRMADIGALVLVPRLLVAWQRQNILALVRGSVVSICCEETLDMVVVKRAVVGVDKFRSQLHEQKGCLQAQVRELQRLIWEGHGLGRSLGMTDSNAIIVVNTLYRAMVGMDRNPLKSFKSSS